MSLIRRYWFAIKVSVLMGVVTIVHFRVGVDHLYPMATNDFAGPFSSVVNTLEFLVPLAVVVIVGATWFWVLVSPVQEERVVRRRVRR